MLEDASAKLAKNDSTGELVPGDILELGRLLGVQDVVRRICETKGKQAQPYTSECQAEWSIPT